MFPSGPEDLIKLAIVARIVEGTDTRCKVNLSYHSRN